MSWFPSSESGDISTQLAAVYWRGMQVAFWAAGGFAILEMVAGVGWGLARIASYVLLAGLAGIIVFLPVYWALQIERGEKGAPPVFAVVFYVFMFGAIVYGTVAYTPDYDCSDFTTQAEAQEFFYV